MKLLICCFLIVLIVSGCSTSSTKLYNKLDEKIILQKTSFYKMKGWYIDDHHEALGAFNKSCKKIISLPKKKSIGGYKKIAGVSCDWREICKKASKIKWYDAREFFEENFIPYRVKSDKRDSGIFTGYHEPNLRGSLIKTAKYKYPIYKMPKDKLLQKMSRAQIENGALKNKNLEILYVDDNVELFFMQIQGSGRVHLENGEIVRLGYEGNNSYNYSCIDDYMISNYKLKRNQMSLNFIKNWLKADPKRALRVMNQNKSYVFFRIVKALKEEGPVGAHNVPLTPERSLAIDNRYLPYGVPLWLETKDCYNKDFNKLLIAQDTGGAIKGSIRGDIFFGSDDKASKKASGQRQKGIYYILLPKNSNAS